MDSGDRLLDHPPTGAPGIVLTTTLEQRRALARTAATTHAKFADPRLANNIPLPPSPPGPLILLSSRPVCEKQ